MFLKSYRQRVLLVKITVLLGYPPAVPLINSNRLISIPSPDTTQPQKTFLRVPQVYGLSINTVSQYMYVEATPLQQYKTNSYTAQVPWRGTFATLTSACARTHHRIHHNTKEHPRNTIPAVGFQSRNGRWWTRLPEGSVRRLGNWAVISRRPSLVRVDLPRLADLARKTPVTIKKSDRVSETCWERTEW